jgi:hypothetical protein
LGIVPVSTTKLIPGDVLVLGRSLDHAVLAEDVLLDHPPLRLATVRRLVDTDLLELPTNGIVET